MQSNNLTPEERAAALDRIAEEAGYDNPEMCALLAMKYEYGLDVPRDQGLALCWLHRAAELGNPWAQLSIGDAYETSRLGNGVDLLLAYEWFLKAFNSGARGAADRLALCYEKGLGTERNVEKSFEYWLVSAQDGSPWAQIHVARMLKLGRGTSKDITLATHYLAVSHETFSQMNNAVSVAHELAEKQYVPAMELLGFAYLIGWFDCPKDANLAADWFRRSDSQNKNDQWGQSEPPPV